MTFDPIASNQDEDEYIESLPKGERQRIMGLIAQDPTSDIEPKVQEPQETDLQRRCRELMDKDWELIPDLLREEGYTPP